MIYNKKVFLFLIFFSLSFFNNCFAEKNEILLKINNEIITSQDISDNIDYLTIMNSDFAKLDLNRKFEISKQELIKQKIKKIELLKRVKKLNLNSEYINQTLKNIYLQLGFKTFEKFKTYLQSQSIKLVTIRNKIAIEALWNEFIYLKYSTKIKIDIEKLRKDLKKNKSKKKSYLLSEIIFKVKKSSDLEKKYEDIKKMIDIESFSNAALTFSISDTAKIGGELGWIDESSISKNIKDKISKLKINEHTAPILIPSGFLILMIDDIKIIDVKFDEDKELRKVVQSEQNNQLKQFSNIYFEKIKKNIIINEL